MFKLLLRLLWWDETAAAGLLRAALMGLGTAVATGMLDVQALGLGDGVERWVGVALIAAGGWVRSSSARKSSAGG